VLAAFLVGAGFRAFFGLGGWSQKSRTFQDHWMPQFALPLGDPLSDGDRAFPCNICTDDVVVSIHLTVMLVAGVYTPADRTWRREFKSGVKVIFSLDGNRGNITGERTLRCKTHTVNTRRI